jgi:magnesium and cobalt exporter, CNNM family
MHPPVILVVSAAVLLSVAFLCSLAESCLRSITPAEITRFTTHHPLVARTLQQFKKHPMVPFATLSLLQYTVLSFVLYTGFRHRYVYPPQSAAIVLVSFTYVFIALGIILPRSLGSRYRETLAFFIAVPLRSVTLILFPLTAPLIFICRRFDRSPASDPALVTNDIMLLTQSAVAGKAISKQQAHLISRSIELSKITAADVMVGRTEMHPIPDTATLSEALVEAHLHHHTRFPLTHEGDLDQIIGYVNFKDIVGALRINPADPTLYGIRRPIESVRAGTALPELLQLFTRGRQHIVIVKDPREKTLGMVTLEDLLEILVGDLEDEYDTPPDFIVQLTEQRFCAGGGATFSELRNRIAPDFPDWDVTINEWILGQTDGAIAEKYTTAFERHVFTVRKITRGKVFDVIIDRGEPVAA